MGLAELQCRELRAKLKSPEPLDRFPSTFNSSEFAKRNPGGNS